MKIVGLVPCAGKAERLGGIPKYLLPLDGGSYLLDETCRKLTQIGAQRIYLGAGLHNQAVLDNYAPANSIVYRVNNSRSMSETVIAAHQYISDDTVVIMAMPDTYFVDTHVFAAMISDIEAGADAAVGLWLVKPEQRTKLGMCKVDKRYKLLGVDDKPDKTDLRHAWGVIAWRVSLWKYIKADLPGLSQALDAGAKAGLDIRCSIAEGDYHDLGTYDAVRAFYGAQMTEAVR